MANDPFNDFFNDSMTNDFFNDPFSVRTKAHGMTYAAFASESNDLFNDLMTDLS